MQTLAHNSPHCLSPNSRRLTAAGLVLCLTASAFAQSNGTAAQTQQPAPDVAAQTPSAQQPGPAASDAQPPQRPSLPQAGFPAGQRQAVRGQTQAGLQGQVQRGFLGGLGGNVTTMPQQSPSAPLPKVPDKLEDMLALALRSNPEILLAESKLRQAQSELNQVHLKVTEQVVSLYYERKKQEDLLAQLNQQLKAVQSAFQAGQTPSDKVIEATIARSNAAAAVPQIEAQTRYLLGLGGETPASPPSAQAAAHTEVATTAPRPEIPEKFRTILEQPFDGDFDDTRLDTVMDFFSTQYKIRFLIDGAVMEKFGPEAPITFAVHDFTLRQALQAMLDTLFSNENGYSLCFVIRDYGILVSTPERARKLYGATIPPEIPMDASAVPD